MMILGIDDHGQRLLMFISYVFHKIHNKYTKSCKKYPAHLN